MDLEKKSATLCNLNLDKVSLNQKFMYIEEFGNSDGSFIIASMIKDQIDNNHKIILILCHNSIGHFYSICKKIGCSLSYYHNSDNVFVIDVMDKIVSGNFLNSSNSLKNLYSEIKGKINEWGTNKNITLIVENIGNLYLSGLSDVMNFIHYLRVLSFDLENSTVICSFHNFIKCPDFVKFSKTIKHVADIIITLKDLRTGTANDVSGHLSVSKREKLNLSKSDYHYLLKDKSFYVFAPGANEFSLKS